MRIAFDLDGVLADLHRKFAATALQLFPELDIAAVASPETGASPPLAEPVEMPVEVSEVDESTRDLPLSRRQSAAVWRHLCSIEDFWDTLEETESGVIKRLAEISVEERWEVIFLTSRPFAPGRTVQQQSQRWLQRHGFPIPSVFVVTESRGRIAAALQIDVVVDDRPDNCLDVALESKARAILVWRDSPKTVPVATKRLGIGTVPTVAACLDLLIEVGKDTDGREGLMPRLRRLLGLQPTNR